MTDRVREQEEPRMEEKRERRSFEAVKGEEVVLFGARSVCVSREAVFREKKIEGEKVTTADEVVTFEVPDKDGVITHTAFASDLESQHGR